MKLIAIETSCDETSCAVLRARGGLRNPKFAIVRNVISSQVAVHAPFGGVVPNLAKREHLRNLPEVWRKIARLADGADLIAVTVGPGLEPALWPGINFAVALSEQLKKPVIGVNHLEGHLYSFLASKKTVNQKLGKIFPAIALVVSGGHTILLKMELLTKWKKLGETRDDAAGEAFDKVARILRLPYPGGPQIEREAAKGNAHAVAFPRPMIKEKNYDFSFSGLKTSVLYYVRENAGGISSGERADIAASFQAAVIDVLVVKTMRAVREFGARSIMLSGGVAANRALRNALRAACKNSNIHFFIPPIRLNTDNAAMIGIAGYIRHLQKKKLRLVAQPNLNL